MNFDGALDFRANGYSMRTAYLGVLLSREAYVGPLLLDHVLFSSYGGELVRFMDRGNAQAFAATFGNTLVIAFRGTSLNELRDLVSDARIAKTEGPYSVHDASIGQVHRGFDDYTQKLWADVIGVVAEHPDHQLVLVGHSLGAAAAVLTAAKLEVNETKVDAVLTYGCPRIGDTLFAGMTNVELSGKYFGHVNSCDVVTRVPWVFGTYHPLRPVQFITRRGNVMPNATRGEIWRDRLATFAKSPLGWLAACKNDHDIDAYVSKLRERAKVEVSVRKWQVSDGLRRTIEI